MKIKPSQARFYVEHADPRAVITALGYEYHGLRSNYVALCHDDRSPSLHFKQQDDGALVYKCFCCDASNPEHTGYHSVVQHYMELNGFASFQAAAEAFAEELGFSIDRENNSKKLPIKYRILTTACTLFAKYGHALLVTKGDTYFEDAGFSKELIEKYQLGFVPFGTDFLIDKVIAETLKELEVLKEEVEITLLDYRILKKDSKGNLRFFFEGLYLFPIRSKHGFIIGFAGRVPPGVEGSKYYNSAESEYFHKNKLLYNFDVAKEAHHIIYVVEGYKDVLSLVEAGFTNVVAAMGTSFTSNHAELLDGKEVILCLDNDEAGQKSMEALIRKYPRFHILDVSNVPYKDWNDTLIAEGKDKVKEYMLEAPILSSLEWLIKRRTSNELNSLEKRKFFAEVEELSKALGPTEALYHQALAWSKLLGEETPTQETLNKFLDYKIKKIK